MTTLQEIVGAIFVFAGILLYVYLISFFAGKGWKDGRGKEIIDVYFKDRKQWVN